jgi:AcrR family transcriptional regulator
MTPTLKDKVILAAVDYIAEFGPDGLSFRRIAADAGVSHQAPYHHFGDRDAIFAEIGLQGFRNFTAVLNAPTRDDEDPEIAPRMLERYIEFALGHKGYYRVMFRSDLCKMSESPELQRAADEAFDSLINAVTAMLGESASVDDIRVTATAMWSVAHGLATLLIDGPLEAKIGAVGDRRALVRAVAKRTLSGLANP